jgi:hypothetical protein
LLLIQKSSLPLTNQQSKTSIQTNALIYSQKNAYAFAAEVEKYAKQYGNSFLLDVPTVRDVNATNANLFTYSASNHMLETWNRLTDDYITINVNETWGTCNWTCGTGDFQISEMTLARGEVGTANSVTVIGRKRFLERWKSTIVAYQVMNLLSPKSTSDN